jgi:hypothetical protein
MRNQAIRLDRVAKVIEAGVDDKRLLVHEGEFSSVLKVINRDGNTASPVVRNAYDTGDLNTLVKNSPNKATGAHISIIGHITKQELLKHLTETEAANGFGNRFLWVYVQRSKVLPEGGNLSDQDLEKFQVRLKEAADFARPEKRITFDDGARQLWHVVYRDLSAGKPGLLGALIARAEAHVVRIASIYALLDRSSIIRVEHLKAALAVWNYCEQSARHIFGNRLGDQVADQILQELQSTPEGLTRTELHDIFKRHRKVKDIDNALALLKNHGLALMKPETTEGRTAERWFAVDGDAKEAN